MKINSRSYNFFWLSIALLPLIGIIFLLPVQPHDYWWYLRLGQDSLQHGVPIVDTYSTLQFGQPIVYQSWLSAVIFWLVYRAGGIPLTVLLAGLLIGGTYAMLWKIMRDTGIGPQIASLITFIAGLAGSNNWTERPQLFAYPLFMAALWLLLDWHNGKTKWLWLLIPFGLAWGNLHGSFVLLFILIGIALIFGKGARKKLLWVALLTFAVTFINPRGFVLWQSVIGTFMTTGVRNMSPEWLPPVNEGWQMNLFFGWLILFVPLASFGRRKLSAFEIILFLAFSWLALTGVRYVIWSIFILAVLSSALIPDSVAQRFKGQNDAALSPINYGMGIFLLLVPLLLLPGIRQNWWKAALPDVEPHTPVAASAWLNEHPGLPGEMWNDVIFGSYLIHAVPSRRVSMDTRIQVIYTAQQTKDYLSVQAARPGWDALLAQDHVNLLFLARTQPEILKAVQSSNDWCEQYHDDVAFIFSRCKPIP